MKAKSQHLLKCLQHVSLRRERETNPTNPARNRKLQPPEISEWLERKSKVSCRVVLSYHTSGEEE